MKTPMAQANKDSKRLPFKQVRLARRIEEQWSTSVEQSALSGWGSAWPVLSQMVSDLKERLDPTLLEGLKKTIKNRDIVQYTTLQQQWGSPQKYETPGRYFAAAVVLSFLKKFPLRDPDLDPEGNAIARFKLAERYCKQTNARFVHYRQFDFADSRPLTKRLRVHEIFHLARRKIQAWIGPCNPQVMLSDGFRHGPGGCIGLPRPFTLPYYKFKTRPQTEGSPKGHPASGNGYTTSTGAYWYAIRTCIRNDAWIRQLARSSKLADWDHDVSCIPTETKVKLIDSRITIADYNKVSFVPKNAKTHRAIATEPMLNVGLQLAVGSYLKKCLTQAGCDLTDQTRNQSLAKLGSLGTDGFDPVTLDLEMASDTLSRELVKELLPDDWYELLDNLRSHQGKFRKEVFKWEKFSSMGNGFTFELESLLFYALAQSVADLNRSSEWFADTFGPAYRYAYVSVFGDDIIVPQRDAPMLIDILKFCGFRVNKEKSFTTGPFRESCGCDFYGGVDVRPFNLERPLGRVRDFVHLHNSVKWLTRKRGVELPLQRTLDLIRGMLPTHLERGLRGVEPTVSDSYIWCEPDEAHASPLVTWSRDWQNWVYPSMRIPTVSVQKTLMGWRYVQFLYLAANDKEDPNRYESLEMTPEGSSGSSVGDVSLSNEDSGRIFVRSLYGFYS